MIGAEKRKIRRRVLNMPLEMWNRLDAVYPGEEFTASAQEFLEKVGLPGALSAYLNDEESKFFDEIYAMPYEEKTKYVDSGKRIH
jgi:hypothetical protein